MKPFIAFGSLSLFLMLSGCSTSSSQSDSGKRFSKVTVMEDTLRRDNQTGLEWVASATNDACKPQPAATTEMSDIALAKAHCDALVFAGYSDWRVATKEEHAEFIKAMHAEGLTPFYANPGCPRVIGVNGESATAINTHNTNPVGDFTPWTTLLQQEASNYGIKCVRNFK